MTGKPLLPGRDEANQVNLIYDKCGTPSELDWPEVQKLKYFNELGPKGGSSKPKLRHYLKDN